MKLAVLTTTVASAAAFAPAAQPQAARASTGLNAESDGEMSQALPFAPRPKLLDGSLPGDVGFDPFGFAGDDKASLMNQREAEIKHARLAMLAAAGWPMAELWDKSLASAFGLEPALTSTGESPSLLNGGLDKIDAEYWVMVVALAGIFEIQSKITKDEKGKAYVAGDCGFDPLGLFPEDKEGQMAMQLKEIKHGRIAMMAIMGYCVQEVLYRTPVTEQTPLFFKIGGGLF